MIKRLLSVMTVMLMAISLSACTVTPAPGPSDPSSESSVEAEPVFELSCFAPDERASGIYDAGDYVLIRTEDCWDMMSEPAETDRSHLRLIDLEKDEVVRTGELETTWEQVAGIRENGDIVTVYESTVRIYRSDLTYERSFEIGVETFDAEVVPEKDLLYCKVLGEGVCAYSFEGEKRQVLVRDDIDFYSSDVQGDHWIGIRSSASDLSDSETFVCSEGSLDYVARLNGTSSSYCFTGGKLISTRADLTPDDEEEMQYVASVYDTDTWKLTGSYRMGEFVDLRGGADEPYAVGVYNGTSEGEPFINVVFCDWDQGKWAEGIVQTRNAYSVWSVYHKKTKRFAIAFAGDENSWAFSVDPERISYPDRLEKYAEQEPKEKHILGEEYAGLREKADQIEKKYPVEILLGDEVLDSLNTSDYTLISFEDPDETSSSDEIIENVGYVLDNIDEALSFFPSGSLDRFRDELGEGGLRFLVVRRLENESMGSFTAGGVQYKTGSWYNVALDMGLHGASFGLGTVQHELWHAVEKKINNEQLMAFDEMNWMELNPDGFEYLNDFESYGDKEEYTIGGDQDVYFVIPYGKVNSMEDRATLIEYVFDYPWGSGNGYEELCAFPHLKAKLEEMAKETRAVFGSVYWENAVSENAAA